MMRCLLVTLAAVAMITATNLAQGTLSGDERSLVAFIDKNNDSALKLLEQVVNINSGTQNFDGVRAVGKVFQQEFDALGFKTRWVDGAPFRRAGHLVAEHLAAGPKLLLIGHLDTVFEADSPFQKFQRIDNRYAGGPGIIDMKGGDVIIVQALKALQSIGALKAMNIVVVMTGDEEDAGDPLNLARESLIAAATGAAAAIGFEDGPGDPKTAVISRRGTTSWTLRVKAQPAHSSQIFRKDIGAGAIFEAARILTAFREKLAGEPHLTFNPGTIVGGTTVEHDAVQTRGTAFGKTNVIAEHAVVNGDMRTLSPEQLAKAKAAMSAIVKASLPHAESSITFEDGYPPLAPTDGNRALLTMYDRASRDVGAGPVAAVDPDRAGAADVSFVAGHVKMILDGVGLMGSNDHTVKETADLDTLPSQTKRAAVFLLRLTKSLN
ncbi:MAG TPA: M20/M25/M40 family metallo-hydrolase [Vicinamibacterales bacterium]|nr:M20/M25/M40 family metallo-hydrolase [Vicinamibacterales bacterium]